MNTLSIDNGGDIKIHNVWIYKIVCKENHLSQLLVIKQFYIHPIFSDSIPWICIYQKDEVIFMTIEITITKVRQAQLGVIFRQEQGSVIIDSVSPHSTAFRSGLRPNDIVLTVENKTVQTVPQVAKLIKSISAANITLKVDRIVEHYIVKSKRVDEAETRITSNITPEVPDETELTQIEQDSFVMVETVKDTKKRVPKIIPTNENMAKFAQTIGNFSLRKRKTSVSESGSTKNTPTSSNPSTPQHGNLKQNVVQIPLSVKKNSICELPEIMRTDSECNSDIITFTEVSITCKCKRNGQM